jgi:hypothetical protein
LGRFLKDFWDHRFGLGLSPFNKLLLEIKFCYSVPPNSPGETETQPEKINSLGLIYRNNLIRVCKYEVKSFSKAAGLHF